MKTKVLKVKAEKDPISNIENPLPNQIYKNPHLEIEHRDLGELDINSIRIRMIYVGICGSDIHVLKKNQQTGYISSSVPLNIPEDGRIIGHEGVGQVIEVGKNVNHIESGMYVTLESIVVCNYCSACKRGDFNQCENAKLLGLEIDGIMGEIVDVNASLAHDISKYIKSEDDLISMACIEPAGVAFDACENAEVKAGDTVAVFGGGPIGLYSALLSKSVFGAANVHIIEPIEFRRNLLKKSFNYVYDSLLSFKKNIEKIDVIIETSGDLSNINKSLSLIDANGRIVLLARSGEALCIDAVDHMITNNIKITGSRGHLCGAFDKILKIYACNGMPLKEAVTSVVVGLEELKEVLEEQNIEQKDCKIIVNLAHE